jgi:hypothetical protein
MNGVSYAVPIFVGGALIKLQSGTTQAVTVIGLDDASLFGRPEMPSIEASRRGSQRQAAISWQDNANQTEEPR